VPDSHQLLAGSFPGGRWWFFQASGGLLREAGTPVFFEVFQFNGHKLGIIQNLIAVMTAPLVADIPDVFQTYLHAGCSGRKGAFGGQIRQQVFVNEKGTQFPGRDRPQNGLYIAIGMADLLVHFC